MSLLRRVSLGLAGLLLCNAIAYSATITGMVKGPGGVAFRGAFVAAQNAERNVTVYVLSDAHGRYHIDHLSAGNYRLFIRAVGYRARPKVGVTLTADQYASADFSMQRSVVRWSDLSGYQGKQLFPAGKMRDFMIVRCTICHFFEHLWAPQSLDAEGWRGGIEYMKSLGVLGINAQQEADLSSYLASLFGPDSVLPKSPEEAPGYKRTLPSFISDEDLNIVYVEYTMPAPGYFPFGATPDKRGHIWIPNHGATDRITRLDPNTGTMQSFSVPYPGAALIHSVYPAPDGSVWLTESGLSHSLGRWDPITEKITEYKDNTTGHGMNLGALPAELGGVAGLKHTVRVAPNGMVWSSGVPLTEFNPKTGKYTHFYEAPLAYDVEIAPNGDVWFTLPFPDKIGKVDAKTMKVSEWTVPTPKMYPRRLRIGPDGMVWVGLAGFPFSVGKMARFDPRTDTFREYPLPGPDPSPYALGFDGAGYLWYNSHYMDTINRFDTKTGKVIQYPFPHSEITMRELFRDAKGRLWYGSNANDVVGYFYLTDRK